jgi:hypothetical protein
MTTLEQKLKEATRKQKAAQKRQRKQERRLAKRKGVKVEAEAER